MGKAVPTDVHACCPLQGTGGLPGSRLRSSWGAPTRECGRSPPLRIPAAPRNSMSLSGLCPGATRFGLIYSVLLLKS